MEFCSYCGHRLVYENQKELEKIVKMRVKRCPNKRCPKYLKDIKQRKNEYPATIRGKKVHVIKKTFDTELEMLDWIRKYRKKQQKLLDWFNKKHPNRTPMKLSKMKPAIESFNLMLIDYTQPYIEANRIITLKHTRIRKRSSN